MAVRRGYKEEEEEEAAVGLTAANAGCGVLGDLSAVCLILIPGGGHISVWHGAGRIPNVACRIHDVNLSSPGRG